MRERRKKGEGEGGGGRSNRGRKTGGPIGRVILYHFLAAHDKSSTSAGGVVHVLSERDARVRGRSPFEGCQ